VLRSGSDSATLLGGMTGRQGQHDMRLAARESQTRSWAAPTANCLVLPPVFSRSAAPLPDLTELPRVGPGPRVRAEWETRDTINSRMWSDMVVSGAHQVTTGMLAAHPLAGAEAGMPAAARQDGRPYHDGPTGRWMGAGAATAGGPTMPGVMARPVPPPASLFGTAWMDGVDVEGGDAARELRGVVKEDNSGRVADTAGRILARTFENQWMTAGVREGIVRAQLVAAERLRPTADDWRLSVGEPSQTQP
jgi:hypothetical protein